MVNYTKFAIKGAATIFTISLLAAFLGYVVRFLLARNLTIEDFGLFYAVFAFLSLIGFFKSLGLESSLIKFIPEFKYRNKNDFIKSSIIYVFLVQLVTNLIIITIIYLLSNYLSINFFRNEQSSSILKILAIAFFVDSFVVMLKFSFQGFQKMMYFAGVDLLRMLLLVIIIYIGLKLNYGLSSAIFAYTVTPIILLFIFMILLLRNVFPEFKKVKPIFDINLFKQLSKYGMFTLAGAFGGIIFGYTDTIVLTYFTGLKNVGLYSVALPTANLLVYFNRAIVGVLFPLTSELWAKNQKILLGAGMEIVYKYLMVTILPAAFVMVSFANIIISVFFGEQYIAADATLKILSFGMIFANLYGINSGFFLGIGKPQINTIILFSGAIFNFLLNLILVPLIGIVGAAIATAISYILMMVFGLIKIKKLVKIKLPIKIWVKTLMAGVIFTFLIWSLKKLIFLNVWLEMAIVLMVSGVVYTALLFLLKVINIAEVKDLYKKIFK